MNTRRLVIALVLQLVAGMALAAPSAKERFDSIAQGGSAARTAGQSAKEKMENAAPSLPRHFDGDPSGSFCAFLTKPLLREGGSGMNRHAEGSTVCYQERRMTCEHGSWKDYGACPGGIEGRLAGACEVEGSTSEDDPSCHAAPRKKDPPPDSEEGPNGNQKNKGNSGGEPPDLMGTSQSEEQLQEEQRKLEQARRTMLLVAKKNEQDRLQTKNRRDQYRDTTGAPNAEPGGGQGGNNTQDCQNLRNGLAEYERYIKEVEDYSRALTTDGSIHPDAREAYDAARNMKSQIQQKMNEYHCN